MAGGGGISEIVTFGPHLRLNSFYFPFLETRCREDASGRTWMRAKPDDKITSSSSLCCDSAPTSWIAAAQLLACIWLRCRTSLSCGTSGSQVLSLQAEGWWFLSLPGFHRGLSSSLEAGSLLALSRTEPNPAPSDPASLPLCFPTGCMRSPHREGRVPRWWVRSYPIARWLDCCVWF